MSKQEKTLTIGFKGDDDSEVDGPCGHYTRPGDALASPLPVFEDAEDVFEMGGIEASELRLKEAIDMISADGEAPERRLDIRLVTSGVSNSGGSSASGSGSGSGPSRLSNELTVQFGWSALESCCAQYVNDLQWTPTPLQYPDFDPPGLAYEWPGSGGLEEGDSPLDLDDDDYPILYYMETGEALQFAYLPCGMNVSVPHSAANSWLKAKADAVSRSLSSYGYKITWEPPIKEYAPDTLFVRGPLVTAGEKSARNPDDYARHPTTLPISFYARIDGEDYKLKTMELRPQQSEHCGYIHFHDLRPDSQIAECEYNAAMNSHAKAMLAWREAFEQWRAQPADQRGDRPTPPEPPEPLPPPDESQSAFSEAFQLTPNTQTEGDSEDAKSLYDLLDQHRDEDGKLQNALIYAVIERTYGQWGFELAGECPDCSGQQARSLDDCDTEIVIAEQAAFFNRRKPGSFNQSYIGDTATLPVAVLRIVNTDTHKGASIIGEYTASVQESGDAYIPFIAPQDGTLSATIDSVEIHDRYSSYCDEEGKTHTGKEGTYLVSLLGPMLVPDNMTDDYTYQEYGRHVFESGGYDFWRCEEVVLETIRQGDYEVEKGALYYFVVDADNASVQATLEFMPSGDQESDPC